MHIREFAKKLNLGTVSNVEYLQQGVQNTIYKLVTHQGTYCLRVYNKRTKEEILFEVKLLAKLSELPITHLIEIAGERIFAFNNKWVTVYSFVEGEHVTNPTIDQVKQAGSFLGAFHLATKGFSNPTKRFAWYDLPEEKIVSYIQKIHASAAPYQDYLVDVVQELKENQLPEGLEEGPIHVDYSPGNVLFTDEKLAAVLDFDNAYIGPYLLDVGKGVMFFASHNKTFSVEKAIAFVAAYEKQRKLSKKEKIHLVQAIRFAFLSHCFVDYYMRAKKVTTAKYFTYIMTDLYESYKDFRRQEEAIQ